MHVHPVLQTRIPVARPRHEHGKAFCAERIAQFEGNGKRNLLFPAPVRTRSTVVLSTVTGIDHNRTDPLFRKHGIAHDRLDHLAEIQLGNIRPPIQMNRRKQIGHHNSVQRSITLVDRQNNAGVPERERISVVRSAYHRHTVKAGDVRNREIATPGIPLRPDGTRHTLRRKNRRNGTNQNQQNQKETPAHHTGNPF